MLISTVPRGRLGRTFREAYKLVYVINAWTALDVAFALRRYPVCARQPTASTARLARPLRNAPPVVPLPAGRNLLLDPRARRVVERRATATAGTGWLRAAVDKCVIKRLYALKHSARVHWTHHDAIRA